MIRNLKRRFVRVVMEVFSLVLALILLGVNFVNRYNVYASIDARLDYLMESTVGPPAGMLASTPQEVRRWVDLNDGGIMSELSYFIFFGYLPDATRDVQLELLSGATGQDAFRLLEDILAGTETYGTVGQYRYQVSRGTPYKVVFLRCESEFSSMRSLLRTSVLVGLVSLLLVLLFVTLLSDKAIRPFAENIENQKRFISNASHELKTPLGVIMSDLDMQILESGETEWLENAQLQADYLALLIEQLTTYSLLGEKKQRNPPVPVDLSTLGESILSDFRPLALAREQTLSADIAPGVFVQGNEDALRTLFSVLLDNAVKYAPVGGEIRLSIRQERRAVIQVENTCDNVAALDFDQLFERFYRDPEHRALQDGHGLGLSIAHDIAAMYGGTLRAASPDGRSVVFTAEL